MGAAFAAGRASHKSGDKDHAALLDPSTAFCFLSGWLGRAGPSRTVGGPPRGEAFAFDRPGAPDALQPAFAAGRASHKSADKAMWSLLNPSTAFCFLAGWFGRAGPSRTVGGPPRGEAFAFDRTRAPDALQPPFAVGRASRASPEVEMSGKPNHPITANGDAHES